jgi:type VI protein secretion system component VasK
MNLSYNQIVWAMIAVWVVIAIMLIVGVWALDRLLNTTKIDNLQARMEQLERMSGEHE